jgi:molybdopterin converting factor small subunit
MKADILQILEEEATTQYPIGKAKERVINSDEFDTVANQIVNLFKDRKYTEEDLRKAIEVGVNAEAGYYPKGFNYKLGISLEDYFINSINKQD